MKRLLFFALIMQVAACNSRTPKVKQTDAQQARSGVKQTADTYLKQVNERAVLANDLASRFKNKVSLDSLLQEITHQEQVKVIARLSERYDDQQQCYYYSGEGYLFKLVVKRKPNTSLFESNTIFYDGNHQVSFKDYAPLCFPDTVFRCENYGFNKDNVLHDPVIIEVCGKRFLYADVSYWCNGTGCGCNLTMIYDMEYHRPVFLENYRIPYQGFLISDFDYDQVPDLLLIMQNGADQMKGFDLEEFELKLVPFSYAGGVARVKIDKWRKRACFYRLYGLSDAYSHGEHLNLKYLILVDEWINH